MAQDAVRMRQQREKDARKGEMAEALAEVTKRGYIKNNLEEIGENGDTPFLAAVRSGNIEGIELLVKAGCNTEARDKRSFTAVLIACSIGALSTVTKLTKVLNVGILQDKDKRGCSPLWIAAETGNLDMVKHLRKAEGDWTLSEPNEQGESPMFGACRSGKVYVVEFLGSHLGLPAMLTGDKDGKTPLQVASEHGHLQVVQSLMTMSKDKVLGDDAKSEGKQAMDYAKKKKHKDIAQYLDSKGALSASDNSSTCTLL